MTSGTHLTNSGDGPLIAFDPAACRDWLTGGAAAEAGIDDGFRSENLTIAAGLEELLNLLNHDARQRCWQAAPHVREVLIWRTADGDGIDGGGLLTIDLDSPVGRIRLACRHQGFDDFVADSATCGIDAATEALGHVAQVVNETYAAFRAAHTARPAAGSNHDAPVNPGLASYPEQSLSGDATSRAGRKPLLERKPMSVTTLSDLDHLRAVFDTVERVQRLEQQLRIVAEHHSTLAEHMRDLLTGDACDAPNALITRAGAQHLAATHDADAADCTAMADTVRRALHPDLDNNG